MNNAKIESYKLQLKAFLGSKYKIEFLNSTLDGIEIEINNVIRFNYNIVDMSEESIEEVSKMISSKVGYEHNQKPLVIVSIYKDNVCGIRIKYGWGYEH